MTVKKGSENSNDTLIVSPFDSSGAYPYFDEIEAYSGNDWIGVYYADNVKINAGSGDDYIGVFHADNVKINAGEGIDTVEVYNAKYNKNINGVIDAGNGSNKLIITKITFEDSGEYGPGYNIVAGKDYDILYLADAVNAKVNLGEGGSYTTLTGILIDGWRAVTENIEIFGGTGADIVYASNANDVSLYLSGKTSSLEGADYVNLAYVNDAYIITGSGNDQVIVNDSATWRNSGLLVDAGDGDDYIQISNTDDVEIYAGDGVNTLSFWALNDVQASAGSDYESVTLWNLNNARIDLGDGSSWSTVYGALDASYKAVSKDVTLTAGRGGDVVISYNVDNLTLDLADHGYTSNDITDYVKLDYVNNAKVITGSGNDQVIVNDNATWRNSGLLVDTGAGDDYIQISNTDDVEIYAGDGVNTLSFWALNDVQASAGSDYESVTLWNLNNARIDLGDGSSWSTVYGALDASYKAVSKDVTLTAGRGGDVVIGWNVDGLNLNLADQGYKEKDLADWVELSYVNNVHVGVGSGDNSVIINRNATWRNRDLDVVAASGKDYVEVSCFDGVDIDAGDGDNSLGLYYSNDVYAVTGKGEDYVLMDHVNDALVETGAGADIISLVAGNNVELVGGNGVDVYKVNWESCSNVVINNGDDTSHDTLYLYNGSSYLYDGNLTFKRASAIETESGYQDGIEITDGNKHLYITNWKNNALGGLYVSGTRLDIDAINDELYWSDHSDIHTLTNADSGKIINGDAHDEQYTLLGVHSLTLNTLGGKDTVIIKNTCDTNINTGEGDDTIVLEEPVTVDFGDGLNYAEVGNLNIHAGAGNDTIEINSGFSMDFYGDEGDDVITVKEVTHNGGGIRIMGGEGNDTLTTSSKNGDIQMYGGNGNDTYIVNWVGTSDKGQYVRINDGIIEYSQENIGTSGKEKLIINGKSKDDFKVTYSYGTLYLNAKDGTGSISIGNWDTIPMSTVEFGKEVYTANELMAGVGLTPSDYEMTPYEVNFAEGNPDQVIEVARGNYNTIKVNGTKAGDHTWCYARIQSDGSLLYEVYTNNGSPDGLKLGNISVPELKYSGIDYMLVGDAKIAIIKDYNNNTYAASNDTQSYIFAGQNFDVIFNGKFNGADELDFSTLIDKEWNRSVRFESSIVGNDLKLRVFKFDTDDNELTLGYVTLKDYCANNMQGNDYNLKVKNAYRKLDDGYQFTRTVLYLATGAEGEFKVAQYMTDKGIALTDAGFNRGLTYIGSEAADVVYAGAGRDYITTGKGDDYVYVYDPNASIYKPNSNTRDQVITGAGNDKVWIGEWRETQDANGLSSNETDSYLRCDNNYVRTGAGKDYVNVAGASNNVGTGDDDDIVMLRGANNRISTGAGNDIVSYWGSGVDIDAYKKLVESGKISQADFEKINGSNYTSGGNNRIDTGAGNDVIYLRNGGRQRVDAGAGDDTIYIGYGKKFNADGERPFDANTNYLGTVRGGDITGGKGNDNYVLVFGKNANSNGNIIDLTANAISDKDTLTIVGVKASDVHFYYNDDTKDLTVDAGQGRVNIVKGWDATLASVVFKDTVDGGATATLSYAQVQDKLEGIELIVEGNYDVIIGTSCDDSIVINGECNTVYAGAGDDVIMINSSSNSIDAGKGDDIITVEKAFNTIMPGNGRDIITINNYEAYNITIDNTNVTDGIGDIIEVECNLPGGGSGEIISSYQELRYDPANDTLSVGSIANIIGWSKNPDTEFAFSDGCFKVSDVNQAVISFVETGVDGGINTMSLNDDEQQLKITGNN